MKFDITAHIDLDIYGLPHVLPNERRSALRFYTPQQLQSFVEYLEDFIKFSMSWEKGLTELLKICKILTKDRDLSKGRQILIILPTATWIYEDDSDFADSEIKLFNWSDFEQCIDVKNNSVYNSFGTISCRCGSNNVQVNYLQLSLGLVEYRYKVQCLHCGNFGPACDNEPEAIAAWNKQELQTSVDDSHLNDTEVPNIILPPVLKSNYSFDSDLYCCPNPKCGKPVVYMPGAKFCIYCGQRMPEWNPTADYKSI